MNNLPGDGEGWWKLPNGRGKARHLATAGHALCGAGRVVPDKPFHGMGSFRFDCERCKRVQAAYVQTAESQEAA